MNQKVEKLGEEGTTEVTEIHGMKLKRAGASPHVISTFHFRL